MPRVEAAIRKQVVLWLAIGVCVSLGFVSWFAYRAIAEWRNSSRMVAAHRASEVADLVLEALTRDMRGVQQSILMSPQWVEFSPYRPYEASNLVASAFALYPYPESFFIWHGDGDPGQEGLVFFHRSDRRPAWASGQPDSTLFPVVIDSQPDVAGELQSKLQRGVSRGRRFVAFEIVTHGTAYQVVAQLTYRDAFHERLLQAVGFTVNLDWVLDNYFKELTTQIARIGASSGARIDVAIAGHAGEGAERAARDESLAGRRRFGLFFFDPLTMTLDAPADRTHELEVTVSMPDGTLTQALNGADRTLVLGAGASLALIIGLILTVRAERAAAHVAQLRSDFVSTVTHELKAPISTIQGAAETLSSGRLTSPEMLEQYGELVVVETKRLMRLIENLLAYGRITDVTEVYSFEAIELAELMDDVQREFQAQLHESGFELTMDMPQHLPLIYGDRSALRLLFDNLVDNALRYSERERRITIAADVEGERLIVRVIDYGAGIPENEIGEVTRKFVRGRRARAGGSGLGLAIVSRIAMDHRATMDISSTVGKGTTVSIAFPCATAAGATDA